MVFSNHAVLQVIDGCVHLIFRVAEMQKQPLLQAVMQVYCVQHHEDPLLPGGVRVEVRAVPLKEPDTDMYNGVLFLGLPNNVVHRVDYTSPLSPPRPEEATDEHATVEAVREHLKSRPFLEVLVLLSGTEDATASSIEARHSYTLSEVVWNRGFSSCVSIDTQGFHCINFENFHSTYPLDISPLVASLKDGAHSQRHSHRCFNAMYEQRSDISTSGLSERRATSWCSAAL